MIMKHTILCIDDETHNLEALERLLRKKYNTITADSGATALAKLKDHQFSLIISDQKMPNMTGVEFFMKAKELQPDAIRILLTGYTDLESVIGAINQGQIYRYITKPWEPEEFLSITQQAIEVFEMKKTIKDQNEQLLQANKELQSLDKLKTDFMLLVNHELKTPLTGIFSYVQLLGEEKMPEDQKLYLNKIEKNTRRLQDLINDTLLITKLKTANKELKTESTDIAQLITDQWNETQKDFPNKNLKLSLACDKAFNQDVNSKYIHIVIKKLLHNSFNHALTSTIVSYHLAASDHAWTLTTENDLVKQMDQNEADLLKAFQTSENILNHSGGTGLGLAVIQAIVSLFSGTIHIETKNKKFKLRIHFPHQTN